MQYSAGQPFRRNIVTLSVSISIRLFALLGYFEWGISPKRMVHGFYVERKQFNGFNVEREQSMLHNLTGACS